MIDCATASDQLLAAEPDELRGVGDAALAAHVRACATCRRQAELLLAEQSQLAYALDALTTMHTAAPAARPARRLPRVLVPLAAAAAAAAILFLAKTPDSNEPLPPILVPPARVAEVPVVNAGSGRNVAVMRTSDPNITVVWYY